MDGRSYAVIFMECAFHEDKFRCGEEQGAGRTGFVYPFIVGLVVDI
jgi:hypothetical protein